MFAHDMAFFWGESRKKAYEIIESYAVEIEKDLLTGDSIFTFRDGSRICVNGINAAAI